MGETKEIHIFSSRALTVEAGGGVFGFGGVAVHESPTHPSKISLFPEQVKDKDVVRGTFFSYDDVQNIRVDGETVWINRDLPDAPQDRQDVFQTGFIELDMFPSADLKKKLKRSKRALKRLGIIFTSK